MVFDQNEYLDVDDQHDCEWDQKEGEHGYPKAPVQHKLVVAVFRTKTYIKST